MYVAKLILISADIDIKITRQHFEKHVKMTELSKALDSSANMSDNVRYPRSNMVLDSS